MPRLTVEVKLDGRPVADAQIALDPTPYPHVVRAKAKINEAANREAGLGPFHDEIDLGDQFRFQSVWALVGMTAREAAETQLREKQEQGRRGI